MRILRKTCVVLLVLVAVGSMTERSFSQARPSAKSNVISIGLLRLIQVPQFVYFQYEWRTSATNSVALRAGYQLAYSDFTGFAVGGAYRFFIADSRALTGLSVAPAADIYFLSSSLLSRTYTSFSVGGDVAYKWIFDQFSVEPIVALRLGISGAQGLSAYSGVAAGIDVLLGYAF